MQKHNNQFVILFLTMLVSLACLSVIEPYATYPADTPTSSSSTMTPAATVTASPSPTEGGEPRCALVTADESLHLRAYDDPTSQVLGYMESGEVVKLLSTKNPEWWMIKHGDMLGYARSRYLEKIECSS